MKNHLKKRETWLPRIMILNKSCSFQNLVWRDLDRMKMTYFFTRDFKLTESPALLAFWNFIKPCSESLMSWNTAREKVKESFSNNVDPFPFLQGQEKQRNRKRAIEPIDQLWLFLTRVPLGLFERDIDLVSL